MLYKCSTLNPEPEPANLNLKHTPRPASTSLPSQAPTEEGTREGGAGASDRDDLLHRHGRLRLGRRLSPPRAARQLRPRVPAGAGRERSGGYSKDVFVKIRGPVLTKGGAGGERVRQERIYTRYCMLRRCLSTPSPRGFRKGAERGRSAGQVPSRASEGSPTGPPRGSQRRPQPRRPCRSRARLRRLASVGRGADAAAD